MYEIRNYMEIIVQHTMDYMFNKKDFEDIKLEPKKLMDIKAIVLNSLPSKYVVTEKGEMYAKLDEFKIQTEADVITQIVKAVEIVRSNPRN